MVRVQVGLLALSVTHQMFQYTWPLTTKGQGDSIDLQIYVH